MPKENNTLTPQEETLFYSPWWAKVCQVLWKLIVVPAISLLLSAISGFLVDWLWNTQGMAIPDNSLLKQWLTNWQMLLLIGISLTLCGFITWWLGHWQVRSVLSSAEQNHLYMQKRLESTYRDLFTRSLEGLSWIDLEFRRKPGTVLSDADRLLPFSGHQRKDPLPGTSIQQMYVEAPGGLLILGDSGAGKTLLLLSLACWLVEQAQDDPVHHPLPMLLPLSSWSIKRTQLLDWCCEQIALIYNVPYQLCKQWIQQGQVILLLDGLDEMDVEDRSACIAAINTYHHEHLTPLVVCSRCTEYEDAARYQLLNFQDAIIIRPLVYDRVVAYLTTMGKEFDALRSALGKNAALRELVTSPLMLSILMRTYRGVSVRGLSKKETALRAQVWTQYIKRMVQQEGNKKRYPLQRYLSWLHWLASQMRVHNQTVFYPECLQPDWLPKKVRRVYTWLAVQGPGALIGGLAGLLTAPLLITLDLAFLLQYSLLSIFLGVLFSTLRGSGPLHTEPKKLWGTRHQFLGRFALSGWLGCMWSMASWLNRSAEGVTPGGSLQGLSLMISGIAIGLSCFLLMILLPRFAARHVSLAIENIPPNWRCHLRHAGMLYGRYALLVAVVFGMGIGLSTGIAHGSSYGVRYGLSYGLSYGFLCIPLSFILVTLGRDVYLAERLGWARRNLLHSLSASKNLRAPLVVVSLSLLLFGCSQGLGVGAKQGLSWGLSWGLSQGLSWSLIWGLSCWFLLGLFQRISREFIDERDRYSFNRGIHDSFRYSLFMSIGSAILIGLASVLSWGFSYELSYALHYGLSWGFSYELGYELSYGLHVGLSQGLSYVWLFALSGGLLAGVFSGGLAVLRHYILRFLLWRTGLFPWKIQPFLMDATARVLLLLLDGGYTFTHRQLLEYLADYKADKITHEEGEI